MKNREQEKVASVEIDAGIDENVAEIGKDVAEQSKDGGQSQNAHKHGIVAPENII